jgi:hypothetical protein
MTRACATCVYHDGDVCHFDPRAEKTSKSYWCRQWGADFEKACGARRDDRRGALAGPYWRASYNRSLCILAANHEGDHEYMLVSVLNPDGTETRL